MGDTDRRWDSPARVVWALITAISVIGMTVSGVIWAAASAARDATIEHTSDIKAINGKIAEHEKSIGDCSHKLDLLIMYHGIKDEKK